MKLKKKEHLQNRFNIERDGNYEFVYLTTRQRLIFSILAFFVKEFSSISSAVFDIFSEMKWNDKFLIIIIFTTTAFSYQPIGEEIY